MKQESRLSIDTKQIWLTLTTHKLIAVAALLSLLILIALIIILPKQFDRKKDNIVYLSNQNELPVTIPDATSKELSERLYVLLSSHFDAVPDKPSSINATIRIDSYEDKSDSYINSASFIIDIDAYQQSYQVAVNWSSSIELPESISIECTLRDESKYPDEKCYGINYDSDSLQPYLPYSETLSSGDTFTATYDGQDSLGYEHILVTIQDCGLETTKEAALTATKEYIRSSGGFDPESFIYPVNFDTSNCN